MSDDVLHLTRMTVDEIASILRSGGYVECSPRFEIEAWRRNYERVLEAIDAHWPAGVEPVDDPVEAIALLAGQRVEGHQLRAGLEGLHGGDHPASTEARHGR